MAGMWICCLTILLSASVMGVFLGAATYGPSVPVCLNAGVFLGTATYGPSVPVCSASIVDSGSSRRLVGRRLCKC